MSVTSPQNPADIALQGDYPTDWSEFVGQDTTKTRLMVAAQSAKMRDATMGHVLLKSPTPGIGKTSLALLVALTLERGVKIVSGSITMQDARMIMATMEDGDVLVIDEIHRMFTGGKSKGEWLLHYLQDGVMMTNLGPEDAPQITIIGATTDAGLIPATVLQRFEMPLLLDPYSDEDGAHIAMQLAGRILPTGEMTFPSLQTCAAIARASTNQPRTMRQILAAIRDLVTVGSMSGASEDYDLTQALEWCGLTEDGLTKEARRYLQVIFAEFSGQVGAATMASRLGEVGDGLAMIETALMDRGYLQKTRSGRTLTREGMLRAKTIWKDES